MKHTTLEDLLLRYGLSQPQGSQLDLIHGCIAEESLAPTSVRDDAEVMDVHIADSLVALELDIVRSAGTLVDLGAGAGFPGLPLAVALPSSVFRLLESQRRKCDFITSAATRAGIANAEAVWARAEEWAAGICANDVVLARAVASPPVVLEYAAPLLRLGGALIDWRGRRDSSQELSACSAAAILGMELVEVRRADPFPGARERHLHIYRKAAETPGRFPRRPGMARKRPLAPSDRDRR